MPRKNKVYIGFVLDETGSMQVVKDQTISGFNEYLTTLRNGDESDAIRFTLTKFNNLRTQVVHDDVKIEDVALLTHESYKPNALTPLYDAVGATIRAMESKVKKNHKILVVIQTDGQENASQEFNRQGIFNLITEKKTAGWTFVFLGADQDAWAAGSLIGIDQGNTMGYASADTKGAFSRTAHATAAYLADANLQTRNFYSSTDGVSTDEED